MTPAALVLVLCLFAPHVPDALPRPNPRAVWAGRIGANAPAGALGIDRDGNVLVAGSLGDTVDLDPTDGVDQRPQIGGHVGGESGGPCFAIAKRGVMMIEIAISHAENPDKRRRRGARPSAPVPSPFPTEH